jgi:hypothetical protein
LGAIEQDEWRWRRQKNALITRSIDKREEFPSGNLRIDHVIRQSVGMFSDTEIHPNSCFSHVKKKNSSNWGIERQEKEKVGRLRSFPGSDE